MTDILFLGPNDSIVNTGRNGNVGIGTQRPEAQLEINGQGGDDLGDALLIIRDTVNQNELLIGTDGQLRGFIRLRPRGGSGLAITGNNDRVAFFVSASGSHVGIGTRNPSEMLEVNGNALIRGDVLLSGADCAEDFDVDESEDHEPGMVMVIGDKERLGPCSAAYDKRVVGVISGAGNCRPGIILGKQHTSQRKRLPLALSGKIYCKVDAQYAPIRVGELLTTSPTSGHAMAATDPLRAFGTVLGKALQNLESGQGLIPILVSLQ